MRALVAFSALTYYFVKLRGLGIGLWNAVHDPLLGYISDRTKSSIGRRLPYIRWGEVGGDQDALIRAAYCIRTICSRIAKQFEIGRKCRRGVSLRIARGIDRGGS